MVVKEINGVQTMLVSYWDAGYIKLDVSDPASPKIIGDSDFGTDDPLMERASTGTVVAARGQRATRPSSATTTGSCWPRTRTSTRTASSAASTRPSGPVLVQLRRDQPRRRHGEPVGPQIKDNPIVGDTRFVGDGCDPATIPQADGAPRSPS